MEIERKFLIKNVEELGFELKNHPYKRYMQGYISTNPTIRVRDEGGDYVLCVKGDGKMAREEFEFKLDKKQFENIWKKVETNAVIKDRYFIPLDGGLTAELDVYFGELSGLATVEVEFVSIWQAEAFEPPAWFGEDVTNDSRYKNTSLSLYGLPKKV